MTDLLATYADSIAQSVLRKDNNSFWPAGIPALSHPSAHLALPAVLGGVAAADPAGSRPSLHPTAVLCLLLYLTHGVRRANLTRADRVRLAGAILQHIATSRCGVLIPDPTIKLAQWRRLPGAEQAAGGGDTALSTRYLAEASRLGAQLWALGEAAYFFCHRLLTERHGPYAVSTEASLVCRHASNLDIWHVWPEITPQELPREVAIWLRLTPQAAARFAYDMFANPIFSLDPAKDCGSADVFVRADKGSAARRLELAEVTQLRLRLAAQMVQVLEVVAGANMPRLARAMSMTMRSVAERVWGISLSDEWPAEVVPPYDFEVRGGPELLRNYYDWRCDWPLRREEPMSNAHNGDADGKG